MRSNEWCIYLLYWWDFWIFDNLWHRVSYSLTLPRRSWLLTVVLEKVRTENGTHFMSKITSKLALCGMVISEFRASRSNFGGDWMMQTVNQHYSFVRFVQHCFSAKSPKIMGKTPDTLIQLTRRSLGTSILNFLNHVCCQYCHRPNQEFRKWWSDKRRPSAVRRVWVL